MANKSMAAKAKEKNTEEDFQIIYFKVLQQLLAEETEAEKREKQVLLDKLKIYIDGKEIVMDNIRSKTKVAR